MNYNIVPKDAYPAAAAAASNMLNVVKPTESKGDRHCHRATSHVTYPSFRETFRIPMTRHFHSTVIMGTNASLSPVVAVRLHVSSWFSFPPTLCECPQSVSWPIDPSVLLAPQHPHEHQLLMTQFRCVPTLLVNQRLVADELVEFEK